MRLENLQYIFEAVDPNTRDPYFENWQKEIHPILMEVALSPEQIKDLFRNIETTASAQGSNRTLAGKAVDAAGEISKQVKDVWFNKLGSALQNSEPVKNFDAKWEDIKAKFAQKHPDIADKLAKYKEFADQNPKTQKFLLAIAGSVAAAVGLAAVGGAAAGVAATGMGVGAGTAIINIADRLLKGQKLSTAVGRGATAGIVAGLSAAGVKIVSNSMQDIVNNFKPGRSYYEITSSNPPVTVRINAADNAMLDKLGSAAMDEMKGLDLSKAMAQGLQTPAGDAYTKAFHEVLVKASDPAYQQAIIDATGKAATTNINVDALAAAANQLATAIAPAGAVVGQAAAQESYYQQTRPLSEGQVYMLLKRVSQQQEIMEAGFMDKLKAGAGKVAGAVAKGAAAVGKQITTNATYPKLLAAWKLEGSPTDSEELKKFLLDYGGIDARVIDKVYADMKISSAATAASPAAVSYNDVKKLIMALPKKDRQRMMQYIKKQLGTA